MPDHESSWLTGILVPVTTPFDPVTGDVAVVGFRENLRRWASSSLDGILIFGSNGEGKLLDGDEKVDLIARARDVVPERMPLVVGAGSESTRATIAEVRRAAAAGADAVLVSPPPYFGSIHSPASLRDHFLAIAEASPVPVLVYHIPKYTHVTIEAGLIGELSRHPNIVGVKDSSGDLKRFAEYTAACDGTFRVLVGSGALLYPALELGAAGGIVGVGLLAPEESARLYRHFRAGETREAGAIQERLVPVHREIVAKFGPAGTKAALDLLGFTGGPTRPPLAPLGEKERSHVARVLRDAALI